MGKDGFKSEAIFQAIEDALKTDGKTLVPKVKGVYCFSVTGGPDGKTQKWIVDAKNGNGSVTKDGDGKIVSSFYNSKLIRTFISAKSDVTITMTDNDLFDLMMGKLNSQKAFFQGKLKIKGNMGLAMKLQEFQKNTQQLQAKL